MVSIWRSLITTLLVLMRLRPRAITSEVGSGSTDTEFTAEVARITEVKPHPNADRLEIAKFDLRGSGPATYEVVIGKGAYKVGDLAAYLSVDCIVPTARPEFKFLLERLDGKGKTHYRLKAARLRGVFSQGLLVNPPTDSYGIGFEFGRSVAEALGVTYHRGEEAEDPSGPTPASKKPSPQPMPIYSVDSMKKCPRLFNADEVVVITEKIHGTNFRFGWVPRSDLVGCLHRLFGRTKYRFVWGSHRVIKSDSGKAAGWYGEDVWTEAATKMGLAARTAGYLGHVFYGELYGYTYSGKPIQDLTYGRSAADGPGLAIFDVKGQSGYLSYPARTALLAEVGLPGVPVLAVGELYGEKGANAKRFAAKGLKSTLDPKQIREGVVVEEWWPKPGAPRRKSKFVGEDYLERKHD